jgi:hypothetical protein
MRIKEADMVAAVVRAALLLGALIPVCALAAEDTVRVELNAAEAADKRCLLTFVVENKAATTLDSLKLDLVVFNTDGIVHRRMVTEMGPVRAAKTIVRSFSVDGECGQIGSVLVNDVPACTPAGGAACLDGLALSSKLKSVRLYK